MSKYKVYVNAGIEIWDEVDAESEEDAHQQAYDLIGHREYQCEITVEKIEDKQHEADQIGEARMIHEPITETYCYCNECTEKVGKYIIEYERKMRKEQTESEPT